MVFSIVSHSSWHCFCIVSVDWKVKKRKRKFKLSFDGPKLYPFSDICFSSQTPLTIKYLKKKNSPENGIFGTLFTASCKNELFFSSLLNLILLYLPTGLEGDRNKALFETWLDVLSLIWESYQWLGFHLPVLWHILEYHLEKEWWKRQYL